MRTSPDPEAVARHLETRLGDRVCSSALWRALYATDASNYRHLPLAVVVPRTSDELAAAVRECIQAGFPLTVRGAGTSLAGQACNSTVIIDTSKYLRRIVAIRPEDGIAVVEPGVTLSQLDRRVAAYGLMAVPDPSTKDVATLGGMYQNNSCGVRSVAFGPMDANVQALEGISADGAELYVGRDRKETPKSHPFQRSLAVAHSVEEEIRGRFPRIPRRISGYSLDALLGEEPDFVKALAGSEGTLLVVTQLTVRLRKRPRATALAVLGFDDVVEAARSVPDLLEFEPIGLEAIDDDLVSRCRKAARNLDAIADLPRGGAWLLIELGTEEQEEALSRAWQICRQHTPAVSRWTERSTAFFEDESPWAHVFSGREAERFWRLRKSALAMATLNPCGRREYVGWEDAAVAPSELASYLADYLELRAGWGFGGSIFGHFGDGCVHTHIDFDFSSEHGIRRFRGFLREAALLVASHKGSLSGEHGDGQARGQLLEIVFGSKIVEAFKAFKRAWDPAGLLNPNRLVEAPPPDANLRHALAVQPTAAKIGFKDPATGRPWASDRDLVDRCVGAGSCVHLPDSEEPISLTMCPSFVATREERHSTRGRARLLFEMALGQAIDGGWQSPEVLEAMQLCIGCKACKSECPAAVDMAAARSELYYQRWGDPTPKEIWRSLRGKGGARPLSDTLVGLFPMFVSASRLPGVLAAAAKLARSPRLAATLGLWNPPTPASPAELRPHRTGPRNWAACDASTSQDVVVFLDCFNRTFRPHVVEAAVELLERLRFRVSTAPKRTGVFPACCGRPFIEEGMLGLARKAAIRAARSIERMPWTSRPTEVSQRAPTATTAPPVIFLEPACLSAVRDELPRLVSSNDKAYPSTHALGARAVSLAEFLRSRFEPQSTKLRTEPAGQESPHQVRSQPETSSASQPDKVEIALFVHCHQKALWGQRAELDVFERFGVAAEVLPTGCCGMAGKFGVLAKYRWLAEAIYESQTKPAMRGLGRLAVVADGFSCARMIESMEGIGVLHSAEVLRGAVALDRSYSASRTQSP